MLGLPQKHVAFRFVELPLVYLPFIVESPDKALCKRYLHCVVKQLNQIFPCLLIARLCIRQHFLAGPYIELTFVIDASFELLTECKRTKVAKLLYPFGIEVIELNGCAGNRLVVSVSPHIGAG